MATFATLDWLVLAAYFGGLLAIAIWVMRQKNDTTEDYFLAGKNAGWMVTTMTRSKRFRVRD